MLFRSSLSFTEHLPARDVELVSPTARLVARDTAHPALVYLLLQAASEVHRESGLFQRAGIPAVVCGPGDIQQAHKPDEFVALDQLAASEAFLHKVVDSLRVA